MAIRQCQKCGRVTGVRNCPHCDAPDTRKLDNGKRRK